MKKIYITHCSAKKDDTLKGTDVRVPPDELYTARCLQRFVDQCKKAGGEWAIFSDLYDVVFPEDRVCWYEKDPDSVTEDEYQKLVENFLVKLSGYGQIMFYHNPGRFHPLYRRLVTDAKSKGFNVRLFSHLDEIG